MLNFASQLHNGVNRSFVVLHFSFVPVRLYNLTLQYYANSKCKWCATEFSIFCNVISRIECTIFCLYFIDFIESCGCMGGVHYFAHTHIEQNLKGK